MNQVREITLAQIEQEREERAIMAVIEKARRETMEEAAELFKQAERDAIRIAARKHIREMIAAEKKVSDLMEAALAVIPRQCFLPAKREGIRRWLITVNAKDGMEPEALLQQMQKCVVKRLIEGHGVYSVEQREEDLAKPPYGWHIHWVLETQRVQSSKSTVLQQVHQCFKLFVGSKEAIDIKELVTDQDRDRAVAYLKGQKADPEKAHKIEYDKFIRERRGLPPFIGY